MSLATNIVHEMPNQIIVLYATKWFSLYAAVYNLCCVQFIECTAAAMQKVDFGILTASTKFLVRKILALLPRAVLLLCILAVFVVEFCS